MHLMMYDFTFYKQIPFKDQNQQRVGATVYTLDRFLKKYLYRTIFCVLKHNPLVKLCHTEVCDIVYRKFNSFHWLLVVLVLFIRLFDSNANTLTSTRPGSPSPPSWIWTFRSLWLRCQTGQFIRDTLLVPGWGPFLSSGSFRALI